MRLQELLVVSYRLLLRGFSFVIHCLIMSNNIHINLDVYWTHLNSTETIFCLENALSTTEEMLKQILEEQKKLGVLLGRQEERIGAIEQKLEAEPRRKEDGDEILPPALLRLLRAASELKTWASADVLAKKVNLSRNLTSGYLARLKEKGYIQRSPNLDPSKPVRYLFKANLEKLPEEIKRLVTRGN